MCWYGDQPQRLDVAYWYNPTMHLTTITLPFNSQQDFHTYTIRIFPDHIDWVADGKLLHMDKGEPNKTMPSIPGQAILILRPNPGGYQGEAANDVKWTQYTPM